MKKLLIMLMFFVHGISCIAQTKAVRLQGELKSFPSEVMMFKESPIAKLLKQYVKINLDEKNRFEVTFELEKPAYFQLGRNTLYLSPEDRLELFVDMDNPMNAKFKGTCSEACSYLKARPFPKAGSYLYGTDVMKDNPSKEELGERVKQEVLARQKKLSALQNVSEKFKKMENGRIQFDAANTLISYCRNQAYKNKVPKEEMQAYVADLRKLYQEDIDEYVTIGSDKDYLNIGVFLNVSEECIRVIGEENMDQEIFDFLKALELVYTLGYKGPVADVLSAKAKTKKELKTKKYIDAISEAFDKYNLIMPGNSAPEINMKNREQSLVKLSGYKGKVVVIDVWATWCGPCKKESPYFEKLAEKYKGNKKMKFISISIDTNLKAWEKYLAKHEKISEQLVCNRTEFEKYILQGVPRFMVIDKEGKIIDAFAPVPSSGKLEKIIESNLN